MNSTIDSATFYVLIFTFEFRNVENQRWGGGINDLFPPTCEPLWSCSLNH